MVPPLVRPPTLPENILARRLWSPTPAAQMTASSLARHRVSFLECRDDRPPWGPSLKLPAAPTPATG